MCLKGNKALECGQTRRGRTGGSHIPKVFGAVVSAYDHALQIFGVYEADEMASL